MSIKTFSQDLNNINKNDIVSLLTGEAYISAPSIVINGKLLNITADFKKVTANITQVTFYRGNIKVAVDSIAPYSVSLLEEPIGVYNYSAKATTNHGIEICSRVKPITIEFTHSKLYRAINLNGPTMVLDSITYESSKTALDFTYTAKEFAFQKLPLIPFTDEGRAKVIRSGFRSTSENPAKFTFSNIPPGVYGIYLYVMKDYFSPAASIKINGEVAMQNYIKGKKGNWAKIGPLKVNIHDGKLEIEALKGASYISTIEILQYSYGRFHAAYNINGPAVKIDNLNYQSSINNKDFYLYKQPTTFDNFARPINPPTDASRSLMLKSGYTSTKDSSTYVAIEVPLHYFEEYAYDYMNYNVYAYVWQDPLDTFVINEFENYNELIINPSKEGKWKLIGPINYFLADISTFVFGIRGANGKVAGIEIWDNVKEPLYQTTTSLKTPTVVYPNPVGNQVKVQLPKMHTGNITLTLIDGIGKRYLENTKSLNNEKQFTLDLPASQMNKGVYMLQIKYGSKVETIRLFKQ